MFQRGNLNSISSTPMTGRNLSAVFNSSDSSGYSTYNETPISSATAPKNSGNDIRLDKDWVLGRMKDSQGNIIQVNITFIRLMLETTNINECSFTFSR